jgi:hypothetical protein
VDRIVDPTYNITSFTANEVTVIFDRINLNITPVKSRIDVRTYPQIGHSGTYAYDSQPFKGTVILNSPLTVSKIGSFTYDVTGVVDQIHGLKTYSANRATCVWDRVKIIEAGATSNVVKANEPITIWCKVVYEYDNELFDDSKGSIYVNDQSLAWSSTNQRWEKEFVSAQPKSTPFKVTGMQERKYGLTTLNDVTSPLSVEWTQAGIPGYPTEAVILGLILAILTYAWKDKSFKRNYIRVPEFCFK